MHTTIHKVQYCRHARRVVVGVEVEREEMKRAQEEKEKEREKEKEKGEWTDGTAGGGDSACDGVGRLRLTCKEQ